MHRSMISLGLLAILCGGVCQAAQSQSRPNVLIITVDDMSADSLGVFGCPLSGTSPTIDAFARESLRFNHAHSLVGNCMPGRNIMWSGLYSHVNGVEGFVQNSTPDYPVLCDLAKEAGYFAAIRGKVSHSTPYTPYSWDAVLDQSEDGKKYHIKDAKSYGESTRTGIALAKQLGRPFCLMVNISDPHKPFFAQGKDGKTIDDRHVPTRVFRWDEVPVPGFLPEDDVIRKELAHYYSSVRRADDCFGEIMKALDESGQAENTFVLFLSDHGMPLPFAKTQLYHHSTRTPLMVRWPGVTAPDSEDNRHMVSAVDLLPTLLDVMGHKHPTPERLHGRSFEPILRGHDQANRDYVVLQYNENSGRNRHPMRGIQTRDFLYLYNPWSDGVRKFATATTGTMTYRQMVKRAETETDIATRLRLFDHRVVEELYDVKADSDCLVNLIGHADHQSTLIKLRNQLAEFLLRIEDPTAPLVAAVDDDSLREDFMAAEDERTRKAKAERQARQKKKKAARSRQANATQRSNSKSRLSNAIKITLPDSVAKGGSCRVIVHHKIPKSLGTQKIHVTLKAASLDLRTKTEQRIHREVVQAEGKGEVRVDMRVPASIQTDGIRVAAFLGEDYESHLQHVSSRTIPVD